MVLVIALPVMPVHSKPNPLMEVGYRVSTSSTTNLIPRYKGSHWENLTAHLLDHGHASSHHLKLLEEADLTSMETRPVC